MKNIISLALILTISLASFADTSNTDNSWRQFDTDENNELSLAEFSALRIAQYTALDRNGDKQWTRREFVKRAPDMTMGRIDALRQKFKRGDIDENGKWDTSEASQAIQRNFNWLDKNKNGSLAAKEFPRYW